MAEAEISTSALFRKFKTRFAKASQAHAGDAYENKVTGRLPAGIENGIAQFNNWKLGTYATGPNKDQPYATGAGTCVFPLYHTDGTKTKGLPTYVSFPLCATGTPGTDGFTSEEDNWKEFQNCLKGLLGPGDHTEAVMGDNLEATIQALNEARPYFRFRTWSYGKDEIVEANGGFEVWRKGRKLSNSATYPTEAALRAKHKYVGEEPRVNSDWGAQEDWTEEVDPAAGVEDSGTPAPASTPKPAAAAKPSTNGAAKQPESAKVAAKILNKPAAKQPDPEPEPSYDDANDLDITGLGERADRGEEEAALRLQELAEQHGVEKTADGEWPGASYAEMAVFVAEAMAAGATPDEGGTDDDPHAWIKEGETCKVDIVPDPKKPKVTKRVDCEIEAVYPDEQEVELKNLTTGKSIMDPKSPINPKSKLPSKKLRFAFDVLIGEE